MSDGTPPTSPGHLRWRHAGPAFAFVLIGLLAGVAGVAAGRSAAAPPSLWLAPASLVCVVAAIVAHEIGHVAAGLAHRFTFRWMTVGPVRVRWDRGRLRVGRHPFGTLWGGAALLVPNDDRDLPRRLAWLVAGGPLASFTLAIAAWIAADGAWRELALLMAVASLAIGLVTVVPSTLNGLRSDGGRLLDLLRGGPSSRRECRIVAIAAAMATGQRPAQWDAGTMRAILAEPSGYHHEIPSLLSVYLWCLDRDAIHEAEAVLTRARDAAGPHAPHLRAVVHLESAWWHAVKGRDRALAERALAAAGDTPVSSPSTRLRARAAVSWLHGARDEATQAATAALAALAVEDLGGATPLLERMTHEATGGPEPATNGSGR